MVTPHFPAPHQCEINYEDCLLQIASTHIIDTVIAHQSIAPAQETVPLLDDNDAW